MRRGVDAAALCFPVLMQAGCSSAAAMSSMRSQARACMCHHQCHKQQQPQLRSLHQQRHAHCSDRSTQPAAHLLHQVPPNKAAAAGDQAAPLLPCCCHPRARRHYALLLLLVLLLANYECRLTYTADTKGAAVAVQYYYCCCCQSALRLVRPRCTGALLALTAPPLLPAGGSAASPAGPSELAGPLLG